MENVAHTLKDLERVVLTWPPSSRTEYAHLRDSMTESLERPTRLFDIDTMVQFFFH